MNKRTKINTSLEGKKFSRLTVVSLNRIENGVKIWNCTCRCGNKTQANTASLNNGHKKSCGCLQTDTRAMGTHNMTYTKTYKTWGSMIQRCTNPHHRNYRLYGGRGITICDKWLNFAGFFEDMGVRPNGLTLDRIDGDKGYFKENCRWATPKEQTNNTSRNVLITCYEKTHSVSEWSRILGINKKTLWNRLFRSKLTPKEAFERKILR